MDLDKAINSVMQSKVIEFKPYWGGGLVILYDPPRQDACFDKWFVGNQQERWDPCPAPIERL